MEHLVDISPLCSAGTGEVAPFGAKFRDPRNRAHPIEFVTPCCDA